MEAVWDLPKELWGVRVRWGAANMREGTKKGQPLKGCAIETKNRELLTHDERMIWITLDILP